MPKSAKTRKKPAAGGRGRTSAKSPTLAERADRHVYYEAAVQCVEAEIDFVDSAYRRIRKRSARVLREDFCGTANTSCEWVRRRRTNVAIGVDLDQSVLEWSIRNRVGRMKPEARERLTLIKGDVLTTRAEKADVLLAMNFSYWLFKSREELRRYFRCAYNGLKRDGVFFVDGYGGSEAHKNIREKAKMKHRGKPFTYIWEQTNFDAISNSVDCYISFAFPDGSRLRRAFEYHWRAWSIPEIRELLAEAGFVRSTVYWEGVDDDTGEGDGVFRPARRADQEPSWICWIAAEK